MTIKTCLKFIDQDLPEGKLVVEMFERIMSAARNAEDIPKGADCAMNNALLEYKDALLNKKRNQKRKSKNATI